ncbi:MAG: hypothetical protein GEV05_23240 [Betaproteobacteria bacterium]|nr:hypothetical protein [Betaproteobacteria bacterium]
MPTHPDAKSDFGLLSPWRDSKRIDDAQAQEHAERLELRARADDEIAAREEYVGLLGVRPGERVLEVGCGSGAVTRALAKRITPGGRVIGTMRVPPCSQSLVDLQTKAVSVNASNSSKATAATYPSPIIPSSHLGHQREHLRHHPVTAALAQQCLAQLL